MDKRKIGTVFPNFKRKWRIILAFLLPMVLIAMLWYWRTWQHQIDIKECINPRDGAVMVWVPAGTFRMGSNVDFTLHSSTRKRSWKQIIVSHWHSLRGQVKSEETPAHTVSLDGFWMYRYEVTVQQYLAFCAATGHALPLFPSGYSWVGKDGWRDPALKNHPIVNVTWYDAKAYADWAGVSLPTEAQWEYAARGPKGHNYPWGGTATNSNPYDGWDQNKCANYDNSYLQNKNTWPVGSFPIGASWCGVNDMAGNVWEWCADWYGPYTEKSVKNPFGPTTGAHHVLRGGSWHDNYNDCRSASRYLYCRPSFRYFYLGFRCVSLSPKS